MNRSTSQNFNFDDAERGEIKILQDFDTVLEWYLKMEGWISYPDIDLFNVEEQIGKLNSNPLIMEVKDYGV